MDRRAEYRNRPRGIHVRTLEDVMRGQRVFKSHINVDKATPRLYPEGTETDWIEVVREHQVFRKPSKLVNEKDSRKVQIVDEITCAFEVCELTGSLAVVIMPQGIVFTETEFTRTGYDPEKQIVAYTTRISHAGKPGFLIALSNESLLEIRVRSAAQGLPLLYSDKQSLPEAGKIDFLSMRARLVAGWAAIEYTLT